MDGRPARSPDDKMDKYSCTIIFTLTDQFFEGSGIGE